MGMEYIWVLLHADEIWSAEDAYTFDYTDNADGGDWVVIGGKGNSRERLAKATILTLGEMRSLAISSL